jgi:hypothetical protein
MPEIGMSGLMSGDRKRSVAIWPKATARLSSTLHGLGGQNETAQFHYAYGWDGGVAVSWVRARAEGAAGGCTPLIGNADMGSFQKELREGLRELGYTEGHNIF